MPKSRHRMDQSKINRINQLAKKQKSVGLSESEIAEQESLRKEYIDAFRKNLRATLDNTVIEYPDGTKKKLSEKK